MKIIAQKYNYIVITIYIYIFQIIVEVKSLENVIIAKVNFYNILLISKCINTLFVKQVLYLNL